MGQPIVVKIPQAEAEKIRQAVSEAGAYFEQAEFGILVATREQISRIRILLATALKVIEES